MFSTVLPDRFAIIDPQIDMHSAARVAAVCHGPQLTSGKDAIIIIIIKEPAAVITKNGFAFNDDQRFADVIWSTGT